MASKNKDIANWGIIDGINNELIKETFSHKSFPTILLLKGDTAYKYMGSQTEDSIKQFIESGHKDMWGEQKFLIPPKVGMIGLQIRYLERKFPVWNEILEEHVFKKIGMEGKYDINQKLSLLAGGTMIVVGLFLVTLIYRCCGPKAAHDDCKDCSEHKTVEETKEKKKKKKNQ